MALNGVGVGTWRYDADAATLDWNDVSGTLIGLPAASGKYLEDVPVHPDDLEVARTSLAACAKTAHPHDIEFRVSLPDGTQRWLHAYGRRLGCANYSTRCVAGILVDITGRKQAELEVAEAQHRLKALIDNMPGVVYRCDVAPVADAVHQ